MRKKTFFYKMVITAIGLSIVAWISTFIYFLVKGTYPFEQTTHVFLKEIAMGLPIYLLGCWDVYKNPAFNEEKKR